MLVLMEGRCRAVMALARRKERHGRFAVLFGPA